MNKLHHSVHYLLYTTRITTLSHSEYMEYDTGGGGDGRAAARRLGAVADQAALPVDRRPCRRMGGAGGQSHSEGRQGARPGNHLPLARQGATVEPERPLRICREIGRYHV